MSLIANMGVGSRLYAEMYGLQGQGYDVAWLVTLTNVLRAVFGDKNPPIELTEGAWGGPSDVKAAISAAQSGGIRQLSGNRVAYGKAVPTETLIRLLGDHIPR